MVSTFKTIELGAIAAGAAAEDTWTPERDITIKKIMINERSGAAVNAVKIYLSLAGQTKVLRSTLKRRTQGPQRSTST